EDELKTGTRREGMYFGINGFMVRIGISLQSVIMGSVLSLSGYNAKLPVEAQSAGTFLGIKFLLVVIPLVSLVFAILFYRLYPLHGAKLRAVKEKLLSIHDKSIRG
ncbi:MAG TPA: MFS transporter, partial [Bacillota bacterium]